MDVIACQVKRKKATYRYWSISRRVPGARGKIIKTVNLEGGNLTTAIGFNCPKFHPTRPPSLAKTCQEARAS